MCTFLSCRCELWVSGWVSHTCQQWRVGRLSTMSRIKTGTVLKHNFEAISKSWLFLHIVLVADILIPMHFLLLAKLKCFSHSVWLSIPGLALIVFCKGLIFYQCLCSILSIVLHCRRWHRMAMAVFAVLVPLEKMAHASVRPTTSWVRKSGSQPHWKGGQVCEREENDLCL